MHVVVNRLTLARPLASDVLSSFEKDLGGAARMEAGFLRMHLVQVEPTEVIVLVYFESRAALDEISARLAGPWFAEHVRSYLAGPAQRVVGEIVASAERSTLTGLASP